MALLLLPALACAPEGSEGGPCVQEIGPPGGPSIVRRCDAPELRCDGVNPPGTCVIDACDEDADCTADYTCLALEGVERAGRCVPPRCDSSSDCVPEAECQENTCEAR